jgi:hypothetical protein
MESAPSLEKSAVALVIVAAAVVLALVAFIPRFHSSEVQHQDARHVWEHIRTTSMPSNKRQHQRIDTVGLFYDPDRHSERIDSVLSDLPKGSGSLL